MGCHGDPQDGSNMAMLRVGFGYTLLVFVLSENYHDGLANGKRWDDDCCIPLTVYGTYGKY